MRRNRRMGDIRLVQDLVKSKAGMRNVRILILTGYGLDHEEDNSKALRMEFATNRESIVVNVEEVKDVEEFAYLGAIVEEKGGGSEDIRNRMQKARGAFQRLWKVWVARRIGKRAKMCQFKTLVRSVLLHGCETWKITKTDERTLKSFQY